MFNCADFEIEIILLNRVQRLKFFFDFKISKMLSLIRIREFDNIIYSIDKFVMITVYANDELFDDISIIAKIIMRTYLINNLKINMLINNNVFVL